MEFNQNNIFDPKLEVKKKKDVQIKVIEEFNYLYPNGHRMTNQMRWFKGSRERGLKSDIAA